MHFALSTTRARKISPMQPLHTVPTTKTSFYAPLAVLLHWTLAVLIIDMIALGWYMMAIEGDSDSAWFFNLHKSIGLVIAGLVLVRLLWRLTHRPAPLPPSVPRWQVSASTAGHWLLYAVMIAMPAFGIIGSLLTKHGIVFFGLPLPKVLEANHDLAELFFQAHSVTAWILIVLVTLHALAGFKHLLIDKDGVFQRMWFSR
ncbi:cytochrome b [soil metagenome]